MTVPEQTIAAALVQFLWQGAMVALGFAVLQISLRRSTAQRRYLAGCLTLAVLAMLPVVTACLEFRAASGAGNGMTRDWPFWLWAAGVLLLSFRPVLSLSYVRRMFRNSAAAPAWIEELASDVARRMACLQRFQVVSSENSDGPAVIGWMRPVILFPVSVATGLTPEQLETILAHEIAHIRRHDYLINLLQIVVETLLFYHPAVWWVSACVRIERERCCDDEVVRFTGDAVAYSRTLTTLERLRAGTPALAMGAAGRLPDRIRRLTGQAAAKLLLWPAIVMLAVAAAWIIVGAQWSHTAGQHETVTVEITRSSTGEVVGVRVLNGPVYLRSVVFNAVRQSLQPQAKSLPQVTVRFPQGLIQQSALVQRLPLAFPTVGSPTLKAPDVPLPIEGPK